MGFRQLQVFDELSKCCTHMDSQCRNCYLGILHYTLVKNPYAHVLIHLPLDATCNVPSC